MEFSKKGLMYPALQLSCFRVRRDSLPPTFALPDEVAGAVREPLPKVRSVAVEQQALQENQRLIEESERERQAMLAVMAKEEEFAKNEKARERNENEMKKRASVLEQEGRARKVEEFVSVTGEIDRGAAEARLERCDWNLQKAVQSYFGD